MYESPVTIISKHIRFEQEEGIFRAIQEYGININKEELIKAINYDRNQYQKGYDDGFADAKNQSQLELERLQHEILSCNTKIEVLQEVKEQLEKDVFNEQMNCDSIAYEYELLKQEKSVVQSEAIKEFAERLKELVVYGTIREYENANGFTYLLEDMVREDIDNLVAEMTESPTKIEHSSLCETDTYEVKE